jgi:TPR repeat protein
MTMRVLLFALMAVGCRCGSDETEDESISIHHGLRDSAAKGDQKAQWLIGSDYFYGSNKVPKDEARGVQYIAAAAATGFPQAQELMGNLLVKGHPDVKKNPKKGLKFLDKSAKSGNVKSIHLVGKAYYNGTGLDLPESERMPKAFKWFKKGAKRGCMHCQFDLADMYRTGKGTVQDYPQALYFYRQVALHFDKIALNTERKPEVLANKTTVGKALNTLGVMYHSGMGVEKDLNLAWENLARAAGIGHQGAKKNLPLVEEEKK